MASLTAGQLVDVLRGFEPDTEIVIQIDPFEWALLDRVLGPCVTGEPDPDRCQRGICLVPGERL